MRERREFGRVCSTIGIADLRLRQNFISKNIEQKQPVIAALDTAAVQLLLLVNGDPVQVPGGGFISTRLRITDLAAIAGIQVLGWKRLVGYRFAGKYEPVVAPREFASMVGSDQRLLSLYEEMATLWYEAVRLNDQGVEAEQYPSPLDRFTDLVWGELERSVYGNTPTELSAFQRLAVDARLVVLTQQTLRYYQALHAGVQMPRSSNGPMWFFEEYLAFDPPHPL